MANGSQPGDAKPVAAEYTSKAGMSVAPVKMPELLTFSLGADSKAAPGLPSLPGPLPIPPVAAFPGTVGVVGKSSSPAPVFSKGGPLAPPPLQGPGFKSPPPPWADNGNAFGHVLVSKGAPPMKDSMVSKAPPPASAEPPWRRTTEQGPPPSKGPPPG